MPEHMHVTERSRTVILKTWRVEHPSGFTNVYKRPRYGPISHRYIGTSLWCPECKSFECDHVKAVVQFIEAQLTT